MCCGVTWCDIMEYNIDCDVPWYDLMVLGMGEADWLIRYLYQVHFHGKNKGQGRKEVNNYHR